MSTQEHKQRSFSRQRFWVISSNDRFLCIDPNEGFCWKSSIEEAVRGRQAAKVIKSAVREADMRGVKIQEFINTGAKLYRVIPRASAPITAGVDDAHEIGDSRDLPENWITGEAIAKITTHSRGRRPNSRNVRSPVLGGG